MLIFMGVVFGFFLGLICGAVYTVEDKGDAKH